MRSPPKGWSQVVQAWRTGELPSAALVEEPLLPEPSLTDLAANFAAATGRWVSGGFAVVDESVYAARSAVCDRCEFWDGAARLGLGKCGHAKCGCTRFKRWLATEKCPLGSWQT